MRPFKTFMLITFLTIVALVYVHQQVELVKLSYSIDFKEKALKDILDRRSSLGYNIANLQDPSRLEGILLEKKIDISFPKKGQIFEVVKANTAAKRKASFRNATIEKKDSSAAGILEFFGLRAEAQARER